MRSVPRRRSVRSPSSSKTPGRGSGGQLITVAAEAAVRQLIASGDHKAALARAKELHNATGTGVSEALLVDAYVARIRSLIQRNLTLEAKTLTDLVRRRYPSARPRLDSLKLPAVPKARPLAELVQPLTDPALGAAPRAALDRALRREVWDLAALARCETLPADHALRRAAAALERACVAATSGPVPEDALRLPEVSHRSPLAPWKLLTCAVAGFYRREDEACQRYLDGIDQESVPARLVPLIRAMVTNEAATPLSPAAARLRDRITAESSHRRTFAELDEAFESGQPRRILTAIRSAVDQCQRSMPDRLESFRQHVSVRCAVADMDPAKVRAALGGPSRHDATFLRLFARATEESRNPDGLVLACTLWEEFRRAAVQEGWFAANGPEAAAVSLRMAGLLRQLPNGLLRELQWSTRSQVQGGGEQPSYLVPEELYQRACVLDPHPEAFSQWMEWAVGQSGTQAKRVATAWHKIRPRDIEPVLRLMQEAEAHHQFRSALKYLALVEQIDPLHRGLRGTRLRLLVGNTLRHLQRKKPWLAAEDVAEMTALPQAQEGDRPALLAALRFVVCAVRGSGDDAASGRTDVERLLGGPAAALLICAVASAARQPDLGRLGPVGKLSTADRAALPGGLARVATLAADVRLKLEIPGPWTVEVAKQFPASQHTLDTDQLRRLAECALAAGRADLAYVATAAGLGRGEATAVRFLLLRAQSVMKHPARRVVCARAAAVLASRQQDPALVEEAAELVRGLFQFDDVSLTLDQARDVLEREKAAEKPPRRNRPGPDYSDLITTACQCATCRRARGEAVGPLDLFDDEDLDDFDDGGDFGFEVPPGMPPEIAELFASEIGEALGRGESVDEFVARLTAGGPFQKRRKKRKRR